MASTVFTLILSIILINLTSASSKFVELECKETLVTQCDQDSVLECVLITSKEVERLKIRSVKWTRFPCDDGACQVVLRFFSEEIDMADGYSFADPHWSNTNKNVSLRISKAAVQHEGYYECEVETSAGDAKSDKLISFHVTAKYTEPTIDVIEKKSQNEKAILECKSIGYPKGQLCWFDQDDHNWTKSATTDSKKMADGRFELSSRLTLLKGSIFNFTCAVFNDAGKEEHRKAPPNFHLDKVLGPQEPVPTPDKSVHIAAPLVVIGSLVVALLLAVTLKLYCKRRHHPTPIRRADLEEGDNESSVLEPND